MVEESGQVVEVSARGAVVSVVQTRACQSCKARQGCGQAVLSEWGGSERQDAKNHFFIEDAGAQTERALRPGDVVRLGVPEDALSRAAIWMYLWPLLPAFLMLWAGSHLSIPEPVQLLMAVLAGASAVAVTRWRFASPNEAGQPRILSIETPAIEIIAREVG
ncbi:SoxR reducing system RseC family protein [Saccharospirillum impatiens]|uniref:SoxR reducing system RseC family protein n=1 Tax=Saccharospirillum impatiens TaxID=169438 RepID=UPI00041B85D9|nr:SoxR reducing system RseC family protein [Saccharospirillum impatiens]